MGRGEGPRERLVLRQHGGEHRGVVRDLGGQAGAAGEEGIFLDDLALLSAVSSLARVLDSDEAERA